MDTKLCRTLQIEFPLLAFNRCRDGMASASRPGGQHPQLPPGACRIHDRVRRCAGAHAAVNRNRRLRWQNA
jgi:hypothetical protein